MIFNKSANLGDKSWIPSYILFIKFKLPPPISINEKVLGEFIEIQTAYIYFAIRKPKAE